LYCACRFSFHLCIQHILKKVNLLLIWMLSGSSIVDFKTRFSSSSITMLCNMTYVINTFVITLWSHSQQGFTMIYHFVYKTPKQHLTCDCLLQLGKMFMVFSLWLMDHRYKTKPLKVVNSSKNVYFHSPQNWGPHLHPPKNPKSKDFYLKRSNHCYFQAIQSMHAKSTTFDRLWPPRWSICSYFCLWMNLVKQLDKFFNDNAYSLMKQTCLASLSLHSLSISFQNLLVWVS